MFSTLSACTPVTPNSTPPSTDAPKAPADGGDVYIAPSERISGPTKAFSPQKHVPMGIAEATGAVTHRVLASVTDARRVRAYIQSMKKVVEP